MLKKLADSEATIRTNRRAAEAHDAMPDNRSS